jgi:hypothetical protein
MGNNLAPTSQAFCVIYIAEEIIQTAHYGNLFHSNFEQLFGVCPQKLFKGNIRPSHEVKSQSG